MESTDSTGTLLGRLPRRPLRHTARSSIEEAIVHGMLKAGERLNEAELSRSLGVSRGLVREALRELESSGVLVSVPYRGTFVKEWTPQSVWELYTLRSILEQFAVELAVARATEQDLDMLADMVQAMGAAAEAGDAMKLVDLDVQFHESLHTLSRHRLLHQVLRDLGGQTRIFIIATKAYYSPFASLGEAAASHQPILEALRRRDATAARVAIGVHIQQVGERYVELLKAKMSQEAIDEVPA
jgi:DNA-binding GntR family transcriptional regulator